MTTKRTEMAIDIIPSKGSANTFKLKLTSIIGQVYWYCYSLGRKQFLPESFITPRHRYVRFKSQQEAESVRLRHL